MQFTWDAEKAAENVRKQGGAFEDKDAPTGMEHREFSIGSEFICGGKRWCCTDVGTRVIVAICLEPREMVRSWSEGGERMEERYMSDDPRDLNGPPYGVAECVFDEFDIDGCTPLPPAEDGVAL